MFGLESLPADSIGILASFVAGILTLFPALGATDARRALTAIVVLIAGVFSAHGFAFVSWQAFATSFFSAAVYAVVSYKMLVQPLAVPAVVAGGNIASAIAGMASPKG